MPKRPAPSSLPEIGDLVIVCHPQLSSFTTGKFLGPAETSGMAEVNPIRRGGSLHTFHFTQKMTVPLSWIAPLDDENSRAAESATAAREDGLRRLREAHDITQTIRRIA